MFNLNDYELLEYIKEDVPYVDLTTYLQDSNTKKAQLEIFTREDVVVSCTPEAARIAELLGCEVLSYLSPKSTATANSVLLSFTGEYEKVHQAWKLSQVLLEYACKMATYAKQMKSLAGEVNPHCEILTTRKSFPFAKRFCIKAILDGGALPHRLGLSESILFFPQHRSIYADDESFYMKIKDIKSRLPEKKIVVESNNFQDAQALLKSGVDVLQMDKIDISTLEKVVDYKDSAFPQANVLIAGGICKSNVKEYVKVGVDGVVTSAPYSAGMANLGTKMSIV